MEKLCFWSHERKSEHLYIVTEGYSMVHRFTIGVVVGDEKVLVIDAGLGVAPGLRDYIERIVGTGKPLICACTHGHPDHVGSALLFDEAYLNSRDYPRLSSFALNTGQRLEDLKGFALDSPEVLAYCQEHYIDNSNTRFQNLEQGQIFDLGGVVLEAISFPGHSPGHHMFYSRQENYVFTGDGINMDVSLKKLDRQGLLQYRDQLYEFMNCVGKDTVLYPAHLPVVLPVHIAGNLAAACEETAMGKTEQDPPGETIFKAKAGNPHIRMHYFNNVCVVYDSSLL